MTRKLILALAFVALALSSCKAPESRPLILAHRGFCTQGGEWVTDENTLDALKRAQDAKVDGVEFDVHMTADGYLVIRHDQKINGELDCQKSNFEDIRAHRLPFGNQIPTLQEWLDQAKLTPEIKMAIEIKKHANNEKEAEVVAAVLKEVKDRNMLEQCSMLSFKVSTCDEILRQCPEMHVILNSSSLHHSLTPAEVAEHGFQGISYNIETTLNHPGWTKEFKDLGIETYFWMVECPTLRDQGAKMGVDWVTTDFYDLVRYQD